MIGRATARLPRYVWPWLLAWLCLPAAAQENANLRLRWIPVAGDTVRVDSLSLAPGSVHVFAQGLPLPDQHFELDPFAGLLIWNVRPDADSVLVRYRVMPIAFTTVHRHKDPARVYTIGERVDPFRYTPTREQAGLMDIQGLERSGSISRGILVGNAQDLSMNSTLNLELSGRLSDRIQVLASVTDNNIPIQAGGNTLELQDFDQVFIKLFAEDERRPGNAWELIAGDFVLQDPRTHFMRYMKKNKGLSGGGRYYLSDSARHGEVGGSVAISKGKFARNVIQGIEGVQGPYKLRGTDGEVFIVVLSGTERVYIDGQLMVRGQENDYTIDYNTAEVTFTARRMITKDRRVVVEFQYSDKNYARSLVRVDNTTVLGRSTVRLNVFSEQDHAAQTLQQQLTDADRAVLINAGDDPLAAVVPGADSTGYAPDQVLYRRTDSLGYSPVYVHSQHPDSAHFRLVFSNVGMGNGDYVQHEFTPNGRVFRWVPPDTVNGTLMRRGDHAPVRVLIPPRSQQLITLGIDHRFSQRTFASVEGAFSRLDGNTMSSAGEADNTGTAVMLRGEHAVPLGGADTTLQLVIGAEAEAVSRHFQYVERYRAVEFERNWNLMNSQAGLPPPELTNDQLLAGLRLGVRGRRLGQAHYLLNTFQVPQQHVGWRHGVESAVRVGRTELNGSGSWLRTNGRWRSEFLRHKAQLRHRTRHVVVGYADEHEHNMFLPDTGNVLLPGSYQFYDWQAFVQSPDSFLTKWRLSVGQRREQVAHQGRSVRSTVADAASLNVDLTRNPNNKLGAAFTYRRLNILDSTVTSQRPEDTYLARLEYGLTLWKGVMRLTTFYEFGSGLEQRQEYIYVQVPAGQGLYVWNDYNGDGIKDLNEFEVAAFGYEADHLRVYVPSNTYVRVYSNQFSGALDVRPAVAWADMRGIKGFLGRFSDMASVRVDRKTGTNDLLTAMDPFLGELRDSSLTSQVASARNTIYYDRTSRTWSVDHGWQMDRSRSLLLNGHESRARVGHTVRLRWNLTRQWMVEAEGERGNVRNGSDIMAGRTYDIAQQSLRPRLTWQPNTSLRAQLYCKFTDKVNRPEFGGEEASLSDLGLEFRYNTAGKGSLQLTANRVDIRYDGEVNSSLGTEMLAALRPGTNYTWSVSLQRNLSNNLQVDLTYNGRSSEGLPVVHVGGAQVRAFF